jgi:hypothetical protein
MAITQASVLPQQYVSQLGQDYGQQLAGLTSIPLDTSQFAPQVAGQDPLQTQAASLAASGVGGYQPYLGQAATQGTQAISTLGGVSPYISAAGALTGTGAGTGAGSISQYMSPYQQAVIDATLGEYDIQAQKGLGTIGTAAVGAGAYGGGRHGIAEAEYQSTSDRNRALLQAGMLQQGYGIGQQARQQDLLNQLTLGGAQAGLAQGQLGMGTYQQGLAQLAPQLAGGDIGTLSQIGGVQQQQAQNVLNAQQQAAQMAAMEPYQRMGVYGQGLGALAPIQGQMQTQQTQDPTALQTALGWTSVLGGIMNPRLGIPQQTA